MRKRQKKKNEKNAAKPNAGRSGEKQKKKVKN
jgi:hypothetical protein